MTEQLTVGRLDSKVKTVVEEATEYDRWKYVLLLVVLFFFFFLRPRTRAKPMRSVRCVEFVIGRIERWIVGLDPCLCDSNSPSTNTRTSMCKNLEFAHVESGSYFLPEIIRDVNPNMKRMWGNGGR